CFCRVVFEKLYLLVPWCYHWPHARVQSSDPKIPPRRSQCETWEFPAPNPITPGTAHATAGVEVHNRIAIGACVIFRLTIRNKTCTRTHPPAIRILDGARL